MSKAILVMDMPNSCDVCDFVQIDDMVGNMTCMNPISEAYGCDVSDYIGCKAHGCPLKPMPEKKEVCGRYPQSDGITPSYKIGYNACIDEILGGSEE